jgi:hypothetical protein
VLDKETGLVWERNPDIITRGWVPAGSHCYRREVANRKGWRLPTIEELASLADNDNSDPALPTDHPFSNVQASNYWSITTTPGGSGYAVAFLDGDVDGFGKSSTFYAWCVRGGQGHGGI